MPDVHLRFGGSTIDRTINCPAWANLADQAPQINRTSDAAERGTMLHNIMEDYYNGDQELVSLVQVIELLDQGDQDAVTIAHAAAEALFDKYGVDDLMIEPMVTYSDNVGGSADVIACSDEVAIILDWKFGHAPVTSHSQFLLYMLAAMNTPGVADMLAGKRLISAIVQPEVSHDAIIIEHSLEDLAKFEVKVKKAVAAAATAVDGNPGPWCKYCPAATTTCKAKMSQVVRFVDLDPKSTEGLDAAVALLDDMKEQVKAVEREMLHNLEAGRPVAGFKLVEKQARRHWIDADQAMGTLKRSKLRKEVYLEPDKLRSPAQIEKAIKAAGKNYDVAPMITKSSSGTTYAPTTDKRPAIVPGTEVPEALDKIINGAG